MKTVLVTGAGSGIGRAIAEAFAGQGARVVLHDASPAAADIATALGATFLRADLADPEAVRDLAARAGHVDVLINNAGFQHIDPVEDFDDAVWAKMIQVMLIAPFQLIKRVLPGMKSRGWGRIVNISSVHGLVASPYKSAYISAKHGVIGLTKTVALEAGAFGVTVNAVCPAYVRTPLVEAQIADQARTLRISEDEVVDKVFLAQAAVKRLIEPSEIAQFVLYLCSDAGAVMTGAAHLLDLGVTAR
jgi:3-hydroxybutyrate dehydrogenase